MICRRFSIKQVVEKTGLEESEIRFYEQQFKDLLRLGEVGVGPDEFTEDAVDLLFRVKELAHKRGFSIDEIRKEFRASARAAGKGKSASTKAREGGNGAAGDGSDGGNGNGKTAPGRVHRPARVIAITSGKGGVGKTTVSVNLALALARSGKKVALVDADLGLANAHILLGIKPRFNLAHVIENGFSIDDAVTTGPEGILLLSGGQGIREMANLTGEQRRVLLRELDRLEQTVDVLLLDTGAGISENVLRFTTFADEVLVVTTPNLAATTDAYSITKVILEMEPNAKIGLLVNMADDMYTAKTVFHRVNTATERHLEYQLGDLGYIVRDTHMEEATRRRQPLVTLFPDSPSAQCLRAVCQTLLEGRIFVNEQKPSAFGDLMGALKRSMVGAA